MQVRIGIRLGGERRIDLAREYGYSDGSATTQILKCLERAARRVSRSSQAVLRFGCGAMGLQWIAEALSTGSWTYVSPSVKAGRNPTLAGEFKT
jgi:hypothetical protein